MELQLKDKVALVTGASSGIGKAVAQSLHAEGAKLVLNARHLSGFDAWLDRSDPHYAVSLGDVTQIEHCQKLLRDALEYWGRLDMLICCVGSGRSLAPGEETQQEWQRLWELNFQSSQNMVSTCTESLAHSKGNIICISSICGCETIANAPVTYSAAKAALNAYVSGIARPLGKRGIRINAVAPGNITFPGSPWHIKQRTNPEDIAHFLEQQVCLQRFGTPEEIANFVCYLSSDKASFATGQTYIMDGGQVHG